MALTRFDDYYLNYTRVNPERGLSLYVYHIDYNGSSYGLVQHQFKIPDYAGERDITTPKSIRCVSRRVLRV